MKISPELKILKILHCTPESADSHRKCRQASIETALIQRHDKGVRGNLLNKNVGLGTICVPPDLSKQRKQNTS